MKSIWSGSLNFGLVTIPVRLYSAIQQHKFGFNILHAKCSTPLEYERWCPHCKIEVPWENTVKGIKKSDGSYAIFTQEMLEAYKPERTDLLAIIACIPKNQIESIYIEHHFFLAPDKKGSHAFFLFQKALEKSDKVAVGKFVMKEKEYICMLEPFKTGLLLNTLYYSYEVRSLEEIPELKKAPKLAQKELHIAEQLIDALTEKTFDIHKYKDEFIEKLKKALRSTKKTKISKKSSPKAKTQKKESLVSILQKSIREHKKPAYAKSRKSPKKS